jgi:hypothetical protein
VRAAQVAQEVESEFLCHVVILRMLQPLAGRSRRRAPACAAAAFTILFSVSRLCGKTHPMRAKPRVPASTPANPLSTVSAKANSSGYGISTNMFMELNCTKFSG